MRLPTLVLGLATLVGWGACSGPKPVPQAPADVAPASIADPGSAPSSIDEADAGSGGDPGPASTPDAGPEQSDAGVAAVEPDVAPTPPAPAVLAEIPGTALRQWALARKPSRYHLRRSKLPKAVREELTELGKGLHDKPLELRWALFLGREGGSEGKLAPVGVAYMVEKPKKGGRDKRDPYVVMAMARDQGTRYVVHATVKLPFIMLDDAVGPSDRDIDGDGLTDNFANYRMARRVQTSFGFVLFTSRVPGVVDVRWAVNAESGRASWDHTEPINYCATTIEGREVLLLLDKQVNDDEERGPEGKTLSFGLRHWVQQPDGRWTQQPLYASAVAHAQSYGKLTQPWRALTGKKTGKPRTGPSGEGYSVLEKLKRCPDELGFVVPVSKVKPLGGPNPPSDKGFPGWYLLGGFSLDQQRAVKGRPTLDATKVPKGAQPFQRLVVLGGQ